MFWIDICQIVNSLLLVLFLADKLLNSMFLASIQGGVRLPRVCLEVKCETLQVHKSTTSQKNSIICQGGHLRYIYIIYYACLKFVSCLLLHMLHVTKCHLCYVYILYSACLKFVTCLLLHMLHILYSACLKFVTWSSRWVGNAGVGEHWPVKLSIWRIGDVSVISWLIWCASASIDSSWAAS